MSRRVLVLLGTKKGAFILSAPSEGRASPASEGPAAGASGEPAGAWQLSGPLCEGWPINHFRYDPTSGRLFAAGGNSWYGAAIWRSDDLGGTWTHSSAGLTYGDAGPAMRSAWHVLPAHGSLYAGVEPAGLFRSDDGGATWSHVEGLTNHPSRETWQPGAGGLICHTIIAHPTDPSRMWVAISAVGCFATEDGGATWQARNHGVRADYLPDPYPEIGLCVHKMVMAAGMPDRLYQQNHGGTYRSDDAGRNWVNLDAGLPSTFGFPMVAHPRDPNSVFSIPLNGDDKGRYVPDARMAVWRTTDCGASWQALRNGLPQSNAYVGVLREAMATDGLDPFGLYFGTSTGQLFASPDEGATWDRIADLLPPIYSVETAVVEE